MDFERMRAKLLLSHAKIKKQKVATKSVVLDWALQYMNNLVSTYQQYETESDDLRRRVQLFVDNILPQDTLGTILVAV
jgi:hypothetical protein